MSSERRRFFRIDDSIGVAYRLLSEEELADQLGDDIKPVDSLNLIASYDSKISNLCGQLQTRDPLVAELLETLNAKLSAVINQLELDSRLVRRVAYKVHEVNISACGMALFAEEAIPENSTISLEMSLKPGNHLVQCYASVISCRMDEERQEFYIRMNFANMSEHDQEILIQHIVRRQGDQLREARQDTRIEVAGDVPDE